MRQEIYKVVRENSEGEMESCVVCDVIARPYFVGQPATPIAGYLMGFDTLQGAENFISKQRTLKGVDGELRGRKLHIYQALGEVAELENRTLAGYCTINTDDNREESLIKFWETWRYSVPGEYNDAPAGTVFCNSIELLKRIEE